MKLAATLLLAALTIAPGAGQSSPAKLRILEPKAGTYAVGSVMVKAALEPPGQAVARMTFFVDGRQVCAVDAPPFQCEWNAGPKPHEHLFHVVAYLPDGKRLTADVRSKGSEYVEESTVDMVGLTVAVLDGGRFVRGLTKDAFRVFEDGVEQPINTFASENVALELVVGVDFSGSMTDWMDAVKEHVKRFLSALQETDRVQLVGFNENFVVLTRPSTGRAAQLRAVDRLAPWGKTALHEAIVRSFDLLGKEPGRRGLVLFTDGNETVGQVTREVVQRRAESSDAVLFMIGQGQAVDDPSLKDLCEWLAKRSGGRAFFPRTSDELRQTFDDVVEELSSQYYLTYAPPSSVRDGTWHEIEVKVRGGFSVRARQGYRLKDQ